MMRSKLLIAGVSCAFVAFGCGAPVEVGEEEITDTSQALRVQTVVQMHDAMGEAVASCDFNHDGHGDLAIGVPGDTISGQDNAGSVMVFYGPNVGSSAARDAMQLWSQASAGIAGAPETFDEFGSALAAGDFNGDGFCDLAIGVPGGTVENNLQEAGAVNVIFGSSSGLSSANNILFDQGSRLSSTTVIPGASEPFEHFGAALAAGDLRNSGFADLVVGAPEDVIAGKKAGSITVVPGSTLGLSAGVPYVVTQDSQDMKDVAEEGDKFGFALAVGDFNGDHFKDLAVGIPEEDDFPPQAAASGLVVLAQPNPVLDAGAVSIIYASASGLGTSNEFINTKNFPNRRFDERENLGWSLAVGDFDADGFADLAAGAPLDSEGSFENHFWGSVCVVPGSSTGMQPSRGKFWGPRDPGMPTGAFDSQLDFGTAVAAANFGGDGASDLVISIPGASQIISGTRVRHGAIVYLPGVTNQGLTTTGARSYTQSTRGMPDVAETGDNFGFRLATGNLDGTGKMDLIIGNPGEKVAPVGSNDQLLGAGAVTVVFASSALSTPDSDGVHKVSGVMLTQR